MVAMLPQQAGKVGQGGSGQGVTGRHGASRGVLGLNLTLFMHMLHPTALDLMFGGQRAITRAFMHASTMICEVCDDAMLHGVCIHMLSEARQGDN